MQQTQQRSGMAVLDSVQQTPRNHTNTFRARGLQELAVAHMNEKAPQLGIEMSMVAVLSRDRQADRYVPRARGLQELAVAHMNENALQLGIETSMVTDCCESEPQTAEKREVEAATAAQRYDAPR